MVDILTKEQCEAVRLVHDKYPEQLLPRDVDRLLVTIVELRSALEHHVKERLVAEIERDELRAASGKVRIFPPKIVSPPRTEQDKHDLEAALKRFGEYQATRDRDAEWKSYCEHTALRLVDRDGKNVLEHRLADLVDWPRDLAHRTVYYGTRSFRVSGIAPVGIVGGHTHQHSHEIVCNEITPADPLRDYERMAGSFVVQTAGARPPGVAGDHCEVGNECGRIGCENCQS